MDGDLPPIDPTLRPFLDMRPDAWVTREVLEQEGPFEYALVEDPRRGREALRTRLTDEVELRGRGFTARSAREMLVTSKLAHPAIAPVHDVGVDGEGYPYVVRGAAGRRRVTFGDIVRQSRGRGTPWSLAAVVRVLERAAEGLAFAHARGWAHGDLEPRHVAASLDGATEVAGWAFAAPLVEEEGAPVSDVALSLADLSVADPAHGRVERTLAAGAFSAPEIAEGDDATRRSDVYALGALLYLALTGHAPYGEKGTGRTTLEVRRDLLAGPPAPVGQQSPLAPAALRQVVRRAMAPRPEDRYPDARAFGAALGAWLESDAFGTKRNSAAKELRAWAGRHRIAAILGASAVAFLVAWALHGARGANRKADDLAGRLERTETHSIIEQEARVRAQGQRLTTLARWLAPQDPTLALRFALRGATLHKSRLAIDVVYEILGGQREVRRFYAYDDTVESLELSADASRLLTRDRSGLVLVHDVAAAKVLARRVLLGAGHSSAHLSPDGERLLTVSDEVLLVDVATDDLLRVLDAPSATSGAFDSTGTRIVVGGADGGIHLFDAGRSDPLWSYAAGEASIDALRFLGDGGSVASLDRQGNVRVMDRDGELLWSAKMGGAGEPSSVPGILDADTLGRRLVAWTAQGVARVFDGATGTILRSFGDKRLAAHPPTLSADGTHLFAYLVSRDPASAGAFAAVADLDSGGILTRFQDLPFLRGPVRAAFSPNGKLVALPLGTENAIGLWLGKTGQRILTLRGHDEPVSVGLFRPDGEGIWSGSLDHTARLWELHPSPSRTGLWSLPPAERGVLVAIDARGGAAVSARPSGEDGEADLVLVETSDGRVRRALGRGSVRGGRSAFAGDGTLVAMVGPTNDVRIVRLEDGSESPVSMPAAVGLVLLDQAGERLVALLEDGRVMAAETTALEPRVLYDGSDGAPHAMALSADGEYVALALEEGLQIRRTRDGEVRLALPLNGRLVRDVVLDPTGDHLAWVTVDGALRIVDAKTGDLVGENLDLWRSVRGLAYAPDGESLLAWSPRGVWLFHGSGGHRVARIVDHPAPLIHAGFDPESAYVVTAARNGLVRLWPLDALDFASARLPAPIHPGQLIQYGVGTREERRAAGDAYVDRQPAAFTLYRLGLARQKAGLLAEAKTRFEEALHLRPDLAWGDYGLALWHTAQMVKPLAGEDARRANREKALEHLARAQGKTGGADLDIETDPLLAPLRDARKD